MVRLLVALALFCLCLPAPAHAATARHALVIGNSDYVNSPLENAVSDAVALREVLRDIGFDVSTITNGGRRETLAKIGEFVRKAENAEVGLLFYAGHGFQLNGENYIVPVDVVFNDNYDIGFDCVSLQDILNSLAQSGCKTKIIILDSCRNSPYLKRVRGVQVTPSPLDAPINTFIAFATSPGQTALDGYGDHSPFTTAILKNIRENGEIEQVFKRIRSDVYSMTDAQQLPWHTTSLVTSVRLAQSGVTKSQDFNVDFGLYVEGGQGQPVQVMDDDALNSGDSYFLHVRPSRECYIYVYQKDSSGSVYRLFPNTEYKTTMNPVSPEGAYLPSAKTVFYLDNMVGAEKIFLYASLKPIDMFENSIKLEASKMQGLELMGPAGVRTKQTVIDHVSSSGTTTDELQIKTGFTSYEINFLHK